MTIHNEAAVQIAEEAHRAGFRAALETARESASLTDNHVSPNFWLIAEQVAWDAFEPTEAMKDLTHGEDS